MATGNAFLCCFALVNIIVLGAYGDQFHEELFIKPLPPAHLYSYFQFITLVEHGSSCKYIKRYIRHMYRLRKAKSIYQQHDVFITDEHSNLSPRALTEVISQFQVEELHLTLTEGQWRHDKWGYPVLDAGPGAELYAWFSPDVADVDTQWRKLSATLSGLFCASLNFIDTMNTVTPQMPLWPMGAVKPSQNLTSQLRYASLPREIVCTENLTPWKKLLPCESSRGFSSLLNSRMIHNTNYHSIGVHVRNVCKIKDCTVTNLEIKQTVALVYDHKIVGGSDWSFRRLFGQGLPGACPLSSGSKVYVDITTNNTQPFKLTPQPESVVFSHRGGSDTTLAVFNIPADNQMVNIAAKYDSHSKDIPLVMPPPLYFNRYVLGFGKEFGGIVTELTNNFWTPIYVVVMENAPWWLPIQLSTLRINGKAESKLVISQYYSPGRSRQKPYHLELLLKLPPRSTTTITIDFEFVFLKWQEYPPDANHGFYIGSALISANLPTARNYTSVPITGSTFDDVVNASQPCEY